MSEQKLLLLAFLAVASVSFATIPNRLTVSFVPELSPNSYRDTQGNRTDLFLDLTAEFCRINEIEITHIDGSFPDNYDRALRGEIETIRRRWSSTGRFLVFLRVIRKQAPSLVLPNSWGSTSNSFPSGRTRRYSPP